MAPPATVRLGPLTQQLLSGARWRGADGFPAWQNWADDVEEVLTFLQQQGRFTHFLTVMQKAQTPQHRDACLAEARGALHFARSGFRIVQWEPPGEGTTKGEVLVGLADSPAIFVEIKQPGWQGEYLPRRVAERRNLPPEAKQQRLARMKQDKYVGIEGGAVGSALVAMDVVRRNALPKLPDRCPNLVVVVDDLKVTPVGLPSLAAFVEREFSNPDHDPDDPADIFSYERLGGVLFLHPEAESSELIYYRTDFVQNPGALPACALPPPVGALLSQMRDQSRLRRKQQFAGGASLWARIWGSLPD
ncbi:MAG TPA: hypothetical protein VFF64_08045 [Candidatus Eremiobacteraceae bacterium]|nr:hypothetical protein [Candidatus Eremiobacteraceae bacterium]